MIRPYHLKEGQNPYWIRTIRTRDAGWSRAKEGINVMIPYAPIKKEINGQMQGKTRRERLDKRWLDNVRQYLKECKQLDKAQNRSVWHTETMADPPCMAKVSRWV